MTRTPSKLIRECPEDTPEGFVVENYPDDYCLIGTSLLSNLRRVAM